VAPQLSNVKVDKMLSFNCRACCIISKGLCGRTSDILKTLSRAHDERLAQVRLGIWENDVGKSKMNKTRKPTRSISDCKKSR